MNNIKILRNFGTIYLWIFAFKVLQVYGNVDYRTDTEVDRAAIAPALLMKPYTYQIFDDDYTDVATPLWQALYKQNIHYGKRLPLITAKAKAKNGNSLTSREITFENLNNFNSYKTKNTIWPKTYYKQQQQQQQEHDVKANINSDNDNKQRRHHLQQLFILRSSIGDGGGVKQERTSMANIRYKQNGILPIPIILGKHLKSKKSKTPFHDANTTINKGVTVADDLKENLFPLKDDNTLNINYADADDDASYENEDRVGVAAFLDGVYGITNSNGNGNESLNYANNNEANTNYMMAQSTDNDHEESSADKDKYIDYHMNRQMEKMTTKQHDKRAKPSIGHTPFLPAVSGGAMTNLGKFFRDLSKNVHVSEQYQWDAEEQKLLEGDPNFGNIHHHLTKPNAATDQQTAEWIKAIRFYRPSQKIRSLVAMNPHGQWAHSSQFIDPNYMWVGLGK